MNVEENRLKTFDSWPSSAALSPRRIAKAGFFFTRRGCVVKCFACHLTIDNWNYGDQAMAKHKALSPICPFVLNPSTSQNIPFLVDRAPQNQTVDYKSVDSRLASFENWPIPEIVTPESLAQSGFYSLRVGDNTKCAYCNGVVTAWEPGDVADLEHAKHFPECPFVVSVITPRIQRTVGSLHLRTEVDSFTNLGLQKHRGPKRPEFSTVEARLRSFQLWSPSLIQTPDILAESGFYYEGVGDQVRCFHCDGGLRHWDPDDDPWVEHARWFPSCSFVKLVKGQEFVRSLSNVGRLTTPILKPPEASQRYVVTDSEIQQHMNSPAVHTALEIGINVSEIRQALIEHLRETGHGYTQADELIEAALTMQAKRSGVAAEDTAIPSAAAPTMSVAPNTSCGDADPSSDAAASLEEENRLLKEARQCKICMDAEVGIVFLPCGHLTTCVNCAPNLEDCPMCRSAIKATVRTFLS